MDVGNKLAEIRKNKGYTQDELAEKVNLKRLTISKYENNHSEPKFRKLQQICSALGITLAELFEKDSEESKKNNNNVNSIEYLSEDSNVSKIIEVVIHALDYEGVLNEERVNDDIKQRLTTSTKRSVKKYINKQGKSLS